MAFFVVYLEQNNETGLQNPFLLRAVYTENADVTCRRRLAKKKK